MRFFFALWPDADVRQRLSEAGDVLPGDIGRRVRPESLHLTLAFLGNVPAESCQALREGMSGIEAAAFTLRLDHFGWFRRARVIWLASSERPAVLEDLVGSVHDLLRDCGLEPDPRPFHPHLTLVRKARQAAGSPGFEPVSWPVREFCLVESVTRADGPEYRVLARRALS